MEQAVEVLKTGILHSNIEERDRRAALYRLSAIEALHMGGCD
jgi:hypothetical protein